MTDRIEKTIVLNAPLERVWNAIADHEQFGAWFRVKLDGPFVAGEAQTGHITYPGYEHIQWRAQTVAVEPMRRLAFQWHPYAVDPTIDYSGETPTLVEFLLTPEGDGVRLNVIESGFDAVPPHRRDEAFRMNEGGWAEQVENIKAHVGA